MREYKLGELVTLNYGKSLPARNRIEGEYPVMSSAGVTGFHNEYLVEGPGVVIGRKGSIGTVYYEPRSFFPIDTCYFLTVNDPKVLVLKYAYYMLLDSNLKELNSDAAVPGLNREIAYAQTFSVPKIERQMEVVSILDGYNDLIENNNQRIQILETIAQKLYQEWFVHYRFPGHEQAQWQETDQGKIPAGWEVKTIEDCYRTSSGGTPSRKKTEYYGEDHNWIKTKELRDSFVLDTEEQISDLGLAKSSAKLFPKHTTIIAMYGATIGRLGITSVEAATNQACCALLPLENIYSSWFAYLTLKEKKPELLALGQGAAQQNISQQVIKGFKLMVPKPRLLTEFNKLVEPIFLQIENLAKKNKNLKQQRDLLLPKLIKG